VKNEARKKREDEIERSLTKFEDIGAKEYLVS
jgi:hypothetical protein